MSGEDGDDDGGGGSEVKDESSNEPCICDICGKTLKHQKSLYSHRRTHTDSKAVCHICGATLKSARYLHHHLLLHKNVEKPHKCDKCSKSFFSSSALKGQSVRQSVSQSLPSNRVAKVSIFKVLFISISIETVHHYYNHEESTGRFQCNVCSKSFKAKQGLQASASRLTFQWPI